LSALRFAAAEDGELPAAPATQQKPAKMIILAGSETTNCRLKSGWWAQ